MLDGFFGIGEFAARRRAEGQNHGCGLLVMLHEIERLGHCHGIEYGGSSRDQDEIGVLCSLEGDVLGEGGRIDNGEVAT